MIYGRCTELQAMLHRTGSGYYFSLTFDYIQKVIKIA
jgi:hypothetical protein